MALNGKKPVLRTAAPPPSDEAFERVTAGALDAGGGGRPGKGREKGKGYAMGNKRQITHMITSELLDRVDAEAERCGEARATVINRAIREMLDR
ncbi:MAG: hypothetical protein PGN33_20065 [Methylobacterium radiotolerans]